jgi:MFS family permease
MANSIATTQPGASALTDREWAVVAASAFGLLFSVGTLLLYSFGVFVQPLSKEFGWTRTQLSIALAVSQYTFAFCSPFWGMAADRFGPRPILVMSVLGLSALVASLALLTPNIWQYYAVFGAVSFLAGAASPIGYSAILVQKFDRHLGLALGLSFMGVGLGAALLPPLAQALVGGLGWREAYVTLGALTLVVTLPAALVATRGVHRAAPRAAGASRQPVLPLIRTRAFILMCTIFLLLGVLSIGALASLVPIMVGRGFTPQGAAQVAAVTGLAAIAGRGGIGWVLDRFHAPYIVCAIALLATAAFLLMAYSTGTAAAYLIAVLLGAVVGAEVDFTAFFVRRYFGKAMFGQLYGLTFGLFIVGSGTGPVLMSASFDWFGTYQAGELLFAAASVGVALLTLAMPDYERHRSVMPQ